MVEYVDGRPSTKLVRLQAAQQELAFNFVAYCHALGLQPFLAAGSALGAWRDQGMIAWDDDIDFGMLREDYEKMIAAMIAQPMSGVSLQSWQTVPGFPFAFAKLRIDGTRVVESAELGPRFHQGIFIDIFPYDPLPQNPVWQKIQYAMLLFTNLFILSYSREAAMSATTPLFRKARLVALWLRPVVPIRALIRLREWVCRLPMAAKSDIFVAFKMYGVRSSWRTRISRSKLVPPRIVPFGQGEMPAPADCEAYLVGLFGEYRTPPPPEKQKPGHIRDVKFGSSVLGLALTEQLAEVGYRIF